MRVPDLDPRTKLVTLAAAIAFTLAAGSPLLLVVPLLVVATALGLPHVRASDLFRRTRQVWWFSTIIITSNIFVVGGSVLFQVGGLIATYEGLIQGFFLTGKVVLILWLSTTFVLTTSPDSILDALESLHSRRKTPSAIVIMMSISLNLIPSLIRSTQRIELAQRARGADIHTGFLINIRKVVRASFPAFIQAFREADLLAVAMEARCFSLSHPRSTYRVLHFRRVDLLIMALSTIAILFVILQLG